MGTEMKPATAIKILAYGISSSALLVLNKVCITEIPNASLLLFIQILSTVLFIIVPVLSGHVSVNLNPPNEVIRAYCLVAFVFLGTIYSNFQVIRTIGVNSFIVLRCGTPLLISLLDFLFLNRELPQGRSLLALFGIFLAGSAYAYMKYVEFESAQHKLENKSAGFVGLAWSIVWLTCFAVDMIYIKHVAHAHKCTGIERTLYQNLLAIPILLVPLLSPLEESSVRAVDVGNRALIALGLSCIAGSVLSYTGMSLRTDLSATSFSILGIVCKMASTLLNEIFVAREANRVSLFLIVCIIISSAAFQQAPIRQVAALSPRRITPSVSQHSKILLGTLFAVILVGHLIISPHFEEGRFRRRDHALHRSPKVLGHKQLWGVMTTILEVNPAVQKFVSTFEANLVVIGDMKTNHSEWLEFETANNNVMYLSPQQQEKLGFEVLRHIPWNHFGRKSIGFLVAIKYGAEVIYDFDDDNHLTVSSLDEIIHSPKVECLTSHHHAFNPYPHFQAQNKGNKSFVWPRGFPLDFINDMETQEAKLSECVHERMQDRVAVLQSLADHDPDVDAIYRLTRPLPIYFKKSHSTIIPPRGTFTPWNAQAVILKKAAFFGMLLPVSVTGRVSDIWRSYITSRLLWDTDYYVGFSSPVVQQFRNPHSYMNDLVEEKDLYFKVDDLISTLLQWDGKNFDQLQKAYIDVVGKLVAGGFLEEIDLELARAWCKDLNLLGYAWPSISTPFRPKIPVRRAIVDERHLVSTSNLG